VQQNQGGQFLPALVFFRQELPGKLLPLSARLNFRWNDSGMTLFTTDTF
jgi:hypothetical protein